MAYASTSTHSPSTAAVRLFSLNNKNNVHRSPTSKIVHLVRHAKGTHNLNEEESKLPAHFDATLTAKGIDQCNRLARHTKNLEVEAVLVSPLTRCLETARLSFPHLYDQQQPKKEEHEENKTTTTHPIHRPRGMKRNRQFPLRLPPHNASAPTNLSPRKLQWPLTRQ
jgi:hypothetical protein